LVDLGVKDIRLLTNNPDKVRAVEGPNREIVVKERVAMIPLAWRGSKGGIRSQEVGGYLKTKVSLCLREAWSCANGGIRLRRWDTCCKWAKIPEIEWMKLGEPESRSPDRAVQRGNEILNVIPFQWYRRRGSKAGVYWDWSWWHLTIGLRLENKIGGSGLILV
jgi:hypothetical protein